jgi:NlpC/P60 family putative phage cell wall peptidase
MISRHAIVAEARDWIGTPYQHQASVKGAGCDCLGLVRGVWRALYGGEPEAAPAYTPDWAERCGEETLLAAARRRLVETTLRAAAPGDVLLFRMDARSPMKHCAILDAPDREAAKLRLAATDDFAISRSGGFIIHAYWGRAVVRSRFAPWWRTRCAAAFSFPDVSSWPS